MGFTQNPEGSADFNRRKKKKIFTARSCLCRDFCEMDFPASEGCRSALELSVDLCFGQGPCATASLQRRHRGTNRHFQLTRLLTPPSPPPPPAASAFKCCMLSRRYPGDSPLFSGASSESEVNYILGLWMAQMLRLQALPPASTCALHRLSRQ